MRVRALTESEGWRVFMPPFCFVTLLPLFATPQPPARHPLHAYLHAQQSPGNASDAARNRQGESPLQDLRGVSSPLHVEEALRAVLGRGPDLQRPVQGGEEAQVARGEEAGEERRRVGGCASADCPSRSRCEHCADAVKEPDVSGHHSPPRDQGVFKGTRSRSAWS